MRSAPLGDRLRVRSPCAATVRWDEMPGSERTRFCASCELDVHDTSTFTRDEVEALIRSRREGSRLCVRIHMRASDGAVLLADGVVLPARALVKRRFVGAVGTAAAAALAAACASPPTASPPPAMVQIPAQPAQAETPTIQPLPSPPPAMVTPVAAEPPPAMPARPASQEPPATAIAPSATPSANAQKSPAKITSTPRAPHTPKATPVKRKPGQIVIIDGDLW